MTITGTEHLGPLIAGHVHDVKMVFNDRGAVIFPSTRQHRDVKAEGISYKDNYAGNALAAMVRRDEIEIRFHQGFSDEAVRRIAARLLALPAFSAFSQAAVTYQGRVLAV